MRRSSVKPLVLSSGEALVNYAQAAALLGTSVMTLKSYWLRTGWLRPVPYREGVRRFLLLEDVRRAGRERTRLTDSRLLSAAEAGRYLGVKVARLVRGGMLREARPGMDLYAVEDLDRALLRLRGIRDPVTRQEAARLAGRDKNSVKRWIAAGRLVGVMVGRHTYCSRAAALKLGRERVDLKAGLERDLRAGKLLEIGDAAKLAKVSKNAVSGALQRGLLTPVRVEPLRRLLVRADELRRPEVLRQLREPFRFGLEPDLLDSRQAAALLGTNRKRVADMARDGRMRVAARCRSGKRVVLGFEREEVLRARGLRKGASGRFRRSGVGRGAP